MCQLKEGCKSPRCSSWMCFLPPKCFSRVAVSPASGGTSHPQDPWRETDISLQKPGSNIRTTQILYTQEVAKVKTKHTPIHIAKRIVSLSGAGFGLSKAPSIMKEVVKDLGRCAPRMDQFLHRINHPLNPT